MPSLDTLAHISPVLYAAFVVAMIPVLWERIRGPRAPEGLALLLGVLPLTALVRELMRAWGAIGAEPTTKLDPRTIALTGFWYALSGTVLLGLTAVGLTLALGRSTRRAAAAMIPGILGLTGWLALFSRQLNVVAFLPQDQKEAIWGAGEPWRAGVVALTLALAGAVAALAPRPVERALALLAVLPLLFAPTWVVWWMVGSATCS